METYDFDSQFRAILKQNGLDRFCTEQISHRFEAFTELLCRVNAHTNLTAIREVPDIIAKHYADCLLAEPYFPQEATVLDVGCGGGFPSVPLAIARPDLQITAVDSTAKKIAFVQAAAASQKMSNLNPLCARIEDPSLARMKGNFDVGTSRAVAKLSVLVELILPYIKVGGLLIALKGAAGDAEVAEASTAIQTLGSEVESIEHKALKQDSIEESRAIILIRKVCQTPPQYPRQYAAILKKPL